MKAVWEMTAEEYHASKAGRPYKDFCGRDCVVSETGHDRTVSLRFHRYVVGRAIAEGKTIPPEVLAEYERNED